MSFVTLISSEGQRIRVAKSIAQQLLTVGRLLEALTINDCEEINNDNEIPISNVSSRTLEQIIEWCTGQQEKSQEIGNEGLFDLISAANYLDMEALLDMGCKRVANMFKSKSPDNIRKTFGIVNDLDLEEESQIRKECAYFDHTFPSITYEFEESHVFRLLDLPNEIISIVFQQLIIADRLQARVCKRLYQIELQGQYHIKNLNLMCQCVNDAFPIMRPEKLAIALFHFDVNVSFDVIMESYIALLRKISRNTTVDNLTMSTFHLHYKELMPYVNAISSRVLSINNTGTGQLDVTKDSLSEWTRERESLFLPRTKLTGIGLVHLFDDMANAKIPLRLFRMDAKTPTLFYFLRNIGITIVDNQFVSTRADLRIIVEVSLYFGSKYFFFIGDNMMITTDGKIMQRDEGKLWMERHDNRGSITNVPCFRRDIPFNSDPLTDVFSYPIVMSVRCLSWKGKAVVSI